MLNCLAIGGNPVNPKIEVLQQAEHQLEEDYSTLPSNIRESLLITVTRESLPYIHDPAERG